MRAHGLAGSTRSSPGLSGGTDLSGGQWQRIALARALCALNSARARAARRAAAQLDVRGERRSSPRPTATGTHDDPDLAPLSTVRHADRICVLEHGKVVELGSHDELMALAGRYRTMFELQASRFGCRGRGGGESRCPRLRSRPVPRRCPRCGAR